MKSPSSARTARLALVAGVALLSAGAVLADYPATVLGQQPRGYWRLNETIPPQNTTTAVNGGSLGAAGNGQYIADASGGLDGPFAGSKAVGFDGLAQNVENAWTAGRDGSSFTFETWVNPANVPGFHYVASSVVMASPRTGWYLAQDDGGVFGAGSAYVVRFFYNNAAEFSGQLSAAVGPANQWMHLALVCNGVTASLYTNGTLAMSITLTGPYVPNASAPFRVGARSDNAWFWPGMAAETALYTTALSAARIAARYTAATTAPATYQATVLADSPVLYYRYTEAGSPPAANLGTLGSAANGSWRFNATPGLNGPRPTTYPGFAADNRAAGFDGVGGGNVRIPALNLNTNKVTISGWVRADGLQSPGAGIFVTGGGATASGLRVDATRTGGNLGLGYIWNGAYSDVGFTTELGLPDLPDNQWTFVALVVEPTKATIFNSGGSDYNAFLWAEHQSYPGYEVTHGNAPFNSASLIGFETGFPARNFKGALDEMSIFNRALSKGELYTQFASAVGGVPPRIFEFLVGPPGPVAAGDSIELVVDGGGTPPMTYTWKRGGTNYASTTSGTLVIPNATLADTETYSVTVDNASGSGVDGGAVYVQVVTPSVPNIVSTEGFIDRAIYPSGSLRLAVNATGGGLQYQWHKNATPIAGATASAYSVPSLASADAGAYSVSLTNVMGAASNGPVTISVPTPAPGSYAASVLAAAPEAWWRMDDAAGSTALLDSMGRHDGTYLNLSGAVPPVLLGVTGALRGDNNAGDPNLAASFSGDGGLGVVPYSSALNPSRFTYEVWVRTTVTDNTDLVPLSSSTSTSGNWWRTFPTGLWSPQGNTGYAPIFDNGNTEAVVVPNAWTQLVMQYDSTRVIGGTAYPWTYRVNGLADGFVWTGAVPTTDGSFIIGGRGRTGVPIADWFFQGQVDEVAVYPRVLSLAEIQANFAARGTEVIPPTFSTLLLSQTVTAGKTVTFSTGVLGTSPTLQWLKDGEVIPEATTASLTLGNVTLGDEGTYTLRAANSAGTNTTSATLTVIPPTGYANVTNDLVLHLRFDGDAGDSSGRGNNGTAVNGPEFVEGLIGSDALKYTTVLNEGGTAIVSANYVNLGAPADLRFGAGTSFSVGLWVKTTPGNTDPDLPYIGNATNSMNNPGWVLGPTFGTGGWQWSLNDGVNNMAVNGPANSINNGGWQHFLLVVDRDSKTANSYLNGVLVTSRDISMMGSLDNAVGAPILIGQARGDDAGTGLYLEPGSATLDDIGIWRRALTPLEVAQIESAGRTAGRSFDTVAPSIVTITIGYDGENLTLSWPSGTLLQSDSVGPDANWTPVQGANPPTHTVAPTGAGKYYRVLSQ